jgi:hypothetical protein
MSTFAELSAPDPDGLPLFGQLKVRGVVIDGPKAGRQARAATCPMSADALDGSCRALDHAFPHA